VLGGVVKVIIRRLGLRDGCSLRERLLHVNVDIVHISDILSRSGSWRTHRLLLEISSFLLF
jgi:hypothetical protein